MRPARQTRPPPGDRLAAMDLNADMGESFGAWRMGDDAALLAVVTSASIACGFHGGDPRVMRRAASAAHAASVVVGAHVSYPDLVGFGRRAMDATPEEVETDVLYQIGALHALARASGGSVRYVKPHGALYHAVASDLAVATALVGAVVAFGEPLVLLGPPGSVGAEVARALGVRAAVEGFADRRYRGDGTLVPRREAGSVLHGEDEVVSQARALAAGFVPTAGGATIRLDCDSICLHSDTPGAVELARAVRRALEADGVALQSFA